MTETQKDFFSHRQWLMDLISGAEYPANRGNRARRNGKGRKMPREHMVKVESTNIESVEYDAVRKEMVITFKSGKAYRYTEVPMDEFCGLVCAPSAGKYFNEFVRGHYSTEAKN